MAGALSAGLTGIFSLVAATLVIYSFYSEIVVPIIGTVLIIVMLIVFPLIAYYGTEGTEINKLKTDRRYDYGIYY